MARGSNAAPPRFSKSAVRTSSQTRPEASATSTSPRANRTMCASQRHGGRQMDPEGAEEQQAHSMRKVKVPSVTSASIDSTRQWTL